jgi:hypothetical protein
MFWTGVVVGVLGTLFVSWLVRDDDPTCSECGCEEGCCECDEHKHVWRVVGAHQMYRVTTIHGVQIEQTEDGEPITEVLYRCLTCDAVETETLNGHWTYLQLSGNVDTFHNRTIVADDEEPEEPAKTEPPAGVLSADSVAEAVAIKNDLEEQHGNPSGTGSDPVVSGNNPDETKGDGIN